MGMVRPDVSEGDDVIGDVEPSAPGHTEEFVIGDHVAALVGVLERAIALGPSVTDIDRQPTPFDSVRVPTIDLRAYLDRIFTHYQCSSSCCVLSLVYVDRLLRFHPELRISPLCAHRLIATSVTVAAKFTDDVHYSNKHYAYVAGVSTREMNRMEANFLHLLGWQLAVSGSEYSRYFSEMLAWGEPPKSASMARTQDDNANVTSAMINGPDVRACSKNTATISEVSTEDSESVLAMGVSACSIKTPSAIATADISRSRSPRGASCAAAAAGKARAARIAWFGRPRWCKQRRPSTRWRRCRVTSPTRAGLEAGLTTGRHGCWLGS